MTIAAKQAGHWCYIAYQPCGCVAGAMCDLKDHPDWTAEAVAEFARSGLRVKRQWVGDGGVKLAWGWPENCPHSSSVVQPSLLDTERG